MKRVVSSSIISVIVLLLLAGAFFYFQIKKNFSASVFKLIPGDVAWLVSVEPLSGDLLRLAQTSFFNGSDSVARLKDWKSTLVTFDSLCRKDELLLKAFDKTTLIISGHVTGPSSYELMFFCEPEGGLPENMEALLRKVLMVKGEPLLRNFNGTEIQELSLSSEEIFSWAIVGGVFVGSTASYLVEDAIRQLKNDATTSPALALEEHLAADQTGLLVAYRYSAFSKWLKIQTNSTANVSMQEVERLGNWTFLHMELRSNIIAFKGETFALDSTSFLENFDNQRPVERKLMDWLPAKTAATIIWGMSDPEVFLKSVRQGATLKSTSTAVSEYAIHFKGWIGNEIALLVTQPAVSLSDNNFLALISVKDSVNCHKSLAKLAGPAPEAVELYNGYAIRYIEKKAVLEGVFGSLFKRVSRFYFTTINHHIVIGNQASVLRAYINDMKTGNLLIKDERFRSLSVHIPKSGNLFFYAGIPQSTRIFKSVASPSLTTWLEKEGDFLGNWNGITFSIENSNGVYKTSGCLGYFNKLNNGPQLLWNAKLDTSIAAGPFFPAGAKGLIFATDVNNTLYAYEASGDLIWKKKLETPLLSEVTAIDYFNSGGHQYLFNTHSFIYLLDSTGNNTGNYPFRLPAEASTGLSLAKGDKSGSESILIPCKNLRLYAYALTGKPLAGFAPMKLPGIITQPVYFNGSRQRLVLLEESGLCFVTDIHGQRLFTVKGTIVLRSRSKFFSSIDGSQLLSFISEEGKWMEIDSLGELKSIIVQGAGDTIYSSTSIDLNGDSENDLIVAGSEGVKATTIDGVSLFKYNNGSTFEKVGVMKSGSKVSILALSQNSVFLFNRDGTLAEGFPLQGIDIPELASAQNKEDYFLLKESSDVISLYLVPGN